MSNTNHLYVIEGIDGSGKSTQFALLVEYFKQQQVSFETLKFPQHGHPFFGELVDRYLNNEFGPADELHPMLASVLYAADRWEAKQTILGWLSQGKYVLLDRYATSNMGHQLCKIEAGRYSSALQWLVDLDYTAFGNPRPSKVFFLDVPIKFAMQLLAQRDRKSYIQGVNDGLENETHMRKAREAYLYVAEHQPEWEIIQCVRDNQLLTPEEIHQNIISYL